MFVIKQSYAAGSHVLRDNNNEPLRFKMRQEAQDRAEMLNRDRKQIEFQYIVVEEVAP